MNPGTWWLIITLSLDMAGVKPPPWPWARGIDPLPMEISIGFPSRSVCREMARLARDGTKMGEELDLKYRTMRCVAEGSR